MERERAPHQLPEAYATALRLRDQGLDTRSVAEAPNIPCEAVDPLLELADAKLARLPPQPLKEDNDARRPADSAGALGVQQDDDPVVVEA